MTGRRHEVDLDSVNDIDDLTRVCLGQRRQRQRRRFNVTIRDNTVLHRARNIRKLFLFVIISPADRTYSDVAELSLNLIFTISLRRINCTQCFKKNARVNFFNTCVKSHQISIIFGTRHFEETWYQKNYKLTHLTYKLLPHYLWKCRNVIY